EVIHRGGQLADGIPVPPHRPQQPAQPRPDRRTGRALRPEDVGRLVHPAVGPADQPPQPGRRGQRPVDEPLEPAQLGPEPPCAPARPMLPLIALSRSWSLSPEAASGGRPSSVRALRTAEQYPRTTSAAGSDRPSTARSIGRILRTFFLSNFFACRSASEALPGASGRWWNWHGWWGPRGREWRTAHGIGCWPSDTPPATGTGNASRTAPSSPARSARRADSRLLASSTSPETQ